LVGNTVRSLYRAAVNCFRKFESIDLDEFSNERLQVDEWFIGQIEVDPFQATLIGG
jgi:hypothetical protein